MGEGAHAADGLVARRIREVGTKREYPAKTWLWHEGDPPTEVLLVESGLLRVDRTTTRGKVVLLDLITTGRLLGELGAIDNTPRSAAIMTVAPAEVTRVTRQSFRELLDCDLEFQAAVLARVVRRLRALSDQFVKTSALDAPGRIAGCLMRLIEIDRTLDDTNLDRSVIDLRLPINQEELGQWSGLSREGVVKGLAWLRAEGTIETGRRRVIVHDLPRLAALAQE